MEFESKKLELAIKWNKESINLSTTDQESLGDFQCLVYSLTQVQPEKQKLIYKGKVLKDASLSLNHHGITDVKS